LQLKPEQGLHMHVPHHKNERNWSRAAISFALPLELAQLLRLYLREGWQFLTAYNGAEDACHVFVDMKGRAFTTSNLALYWNKMTQGMNMPALSPSQCRQVFVAERRSEARVAGPNDRGAAMVMGHSVQQWDKWYDLDFHARQAQQAVDAMSTWRQTLLAQAAQPQPQAQLLPQPQPQPQPCMHAAALPSTVPPTLPDSTTGMPDAMDEEDLYVDIGN